MDDVGQQAKQWTGEAKERVQAFFVDGSEEAIHKIKAELMSKVITSDLCSY